MAMTSTGTITATSGITTGVNTTATCPHVTHVIFATGFTPSVGNAPYYIAQSKGYYTANCLDVEIKYGQVPNLAQAVSDGSIQFMSVSGDLVIPARLKGANIKYVMATFQKYPVGALALANKGFTLSSPADLRDTASATLLLAAQPRLAWKQCSRREG